MAKSKDARATAAKEPPPRTSKGKAEKEESTAPVPDLPTGLRRHLPAE